MWSKIKAHLRKAEARSYERLIEAIGQAFAAITAQDAAGYFFSCGYTTSQSCSAIAITNDPVANVIGLGIRIDYEHEREINRGTL